VISSRSSTTRAFLTVIHRSSLVGWKLRIQVPPRPP
jgi:hypothetical protein